MAEDGILGFKFNDREEDFARDVKILEATKLLFSETGFDSGLGHLAEGEDEILMKPAEFDGGEFRESFEFVDSFDFAM